MTNCIFCDIIAGKTDTKYVYEDDKIVVFSDIRPKADVHLLFVTREHIKSLVEVNQQHKDLIYHLTAAIPKVAAQQKLINGFRVIVNTGRGGGQLIDHLHYHLIAGKLPPF